MNRRFLETALLLATLALPATAKAQPVGVTFAAGAIGDADAASATRPTVPVFTLSVQGVMKRYFVIEGELAYWARTTRNEQGPHNINGPAGVLGQVSRTTIADAHELWNVGVNFLVRSAGRVRVFGGGGASLSMDNSEYSQQSFDCSPSLDPRVCERFVNARVRGPIPVFRGIGGVDVPVTARLGMFAALRAEATAWEDRNNLLAGVAGVRFSVK